MRSRIVASCLLVPLMLGSSVAQDDGVVRRIIKAAKVAVDFDNWPGKKGLLRAGFVFTQSDFTELDGFDVEEDNRVIGLGDGKEKTEVTRSIIFEKGLDRVFVTVQVSQRSTDDAHENLLSSLTTSQLGAEVGSKRGEPLSVNVGDLNFINPNSKVSELSKILKIRFVRNNVRINLSKQGADSVDLLSIAQKIDTKLIGQPTFNKNQLKAKLPTIQQFVLQSKQIPRYSSTPITLAAVDPQGLELTFDFEVNIGGVKRDEEVDPPTTTFFSGLETGKAELEAFAINDALLFRSAKASVRVVE